MSAASTFEIPVAHIDDPESITLLVHKLKDLHGSEFDFNVQSWDGETTLCAPPQKTAFFFVMRAQKATIALMPKDRIRGPSLNGPYHIYQAPWAEVTAEHTEEIWPGDTIAANTEIGDTKLTGSGIYYQVTTPTTSYCAPKLALLRNLENKPGGCAAYDNAFRREALPPEATDKTDHMGANRVNHHTLDMRPDRTPLPTRHHHGQVQGPSKMLNHTETALVLPRSVYGLPEVNANTEGHALFYRNPLTCGTSDAFTVPVKPGSIVVTPSTAKHLYGHCFENAFAMLIAIPGFVAPYVMIED